MSSAATDEPRVPGYRWTGFVLVLVLAFVAGFARIGADCDWLVALGDRIRATGHIPTGVPFATAPSGHWHNALVGSELLLSLVHAVGLPAMVVLQLCAVLASLLVLDRDARACGAGDGAIALSLALLVVGGIGSLVIVRVSLFSLVLFAVVIAVLRAQHRRPSRAVWWLPVLVAVWTNLHGAVLVGVAVIGAYLAFSRLRSRAAESIGVGLACVVALLITPAGPATAAYFWTILHNRAAARGVGLWSRLSFSRPVDVVFVVVAVVVIAVILTGARRTARRPPGGALPLWEWIVLVALVIACVQSARNGIMLLLFAAGPAALAMTRRGPRSPTNARLLDSAIALALAAVVAGSIVAVRHAATIELTGPVAVEGIVRTTAGRTVLAPSPVAEQLAVAGSRLWLSNPIDAFDAADQDRYLDFADPASRFDAALLRTDIGAVVVGDGSAQEAAIRSVTAFRYAGRAGGWRIYLRR